MFLLSFKLLPHQRQCTGKGRRDAWPQRVIERLEPRQLLSGEFYPKVDYPAGSRPSSVVAADLNSDGKPDLAIADKDSGVLSVLLNNGNGTFAARSEFTAGTGACSVTSADFNSDGKPDLAVAGSVGIMVFINAGLGLTSQLYSDAFAAISLVSADFNVDGKPDLAYVTSRANSAVSIMMNNGNGAFAAAVDYDPGFAPCALSAGDYNEDGKPDLAVAWDYADSIGVFLNNGEGAFPSKSSYDVGDRPLALVSADFNADGKTDLGVANDYGKSVSVLLNKGNGAFAGKVNYDTHHSASAITAADFNGDGQVDLAVAHKGSDNLSMLINIGNGTFAPRVAHPVGYGPTAVTAADLNADGKTDLVVTNFWDDTVSVLFSGSDVAFASKVDYSAGSGPRSLVSADFSGDGRPDVVALSSYDARVTLIPNNGDGTFGATRIVGSTWRSPWSVASADFNADGRMDLAVAEPGGYMLSIFLNNADGSFTASSYEASPTGDPCALTTGDFIGDAMPDVAMAAGKYSSFSVFRNLNKAIFFWRYDFSAGYKHGAIASADFNGDGKADLVVTNDYGESIGDPPSLDSVSVLINDGAGNFVETTYVIGYNPYSVAAVDLNGDGKPDLAVATFGHSTAPSTVSVLLNNGDGTFAERTEYHTGQSPRSVCAADFDGDGKLDLATANSTHNTVSVLLNHGNGAFPSRIDYAVGEEPYSVTSADFNGDGKPDLAVANYSEGNVSILLNTTQAVVKVAIDQAATQPDPAAASPIHFTAVFSNPVTGFTGQDVILGGTAGATTAIVTGGGDTYDVAVSGMTRSGTVTVSIPGNAAQNAAGVWNVPSTSTDRTIMFDPPFALMTPPAAGASVARNQSYRIHWIGGAPGASLQIWRRSAQGSVRLVDAVPAQQGYYDWDTVGVADGWYCFGAWVNPGDGGKWHYAASPGWLHVVNQVPSITFATPAVPSAVNQGQPFAINWQASDPNGDPLHVALWAYSKDTGWFALPGAEWLDAAIGTYVWSTSNAKPGWYCFAGNLWDGSATATGKSPNWLQVIAQKPTFAFLTPTKDQKTSFGSTFSIQWQATVPQQYQNQTKVELWACYLDWKDNNRPVWQRLAANLNPAASAYSWSTSNLNRNYHWYSFAAWIGYGSVWVNVASQHWLQIV